MKRLAIIIACFLAVLLLNDRVQAQTGYYITSQDGTKLYVQEFGKGSPVILLAGGPGLNPVYLKPVWEKLDKDHRCIVLNQRGTGKTLLAQIDSANLSVDDYVNDLEALRKHLGLKKLVLVGHSWGGMLAMLYLSKERRHVQKMVLIDPGGPRKTWVEVFQTNMAKKLTKSDLAELKKTTSMHMPSMSAIWPGYFYHRDRALATRAMAKGIVGQQGVTRLTLSNYFDNSASMISALRKVKTIPVILIKGKQDPMGKSTAMEIKSILTQTKIELIEHCGHLPWLEEPKQVKEFYSLLQKALK